MVDLRTCRMSFLMAKRAMTICFQNVANTALREGRTLCNIKCVLRHTSMYIGLAYADPQNINILNVLVYFRDVTNIDSVGGVALLLLL